MIEKLDHACLTVSDLEKSIEFYKKLGFTDLVFLEPTGPHWDKLFGIPGFQVRVAYFKGGSLELTQFPASISEQRIDAKPQNVGHMFLIFHVTDIDNLYNKLIKDGVSFVMPPFQPQEQVPGGRTVKLTHLFGPDGERISLLQFQEPS